MATEFLKISNFRIQECYITVSEFDSIRIRFRQILNLSAFDSIRILRELLKLTFLENVDFMLILVSHLFWKKEYRRDNSYSRTPIGVGGGHDNNIFCYSQ